MSKYFAWEPSLLGPVASIWQDKQTDGNGKVKLTLMPLVPLLDNDIRSIEELKRDYPYAEK